MLNPLSFKALQKDILETFFYPLNCYSTFCSYAGLDDDWVLKF